MGLNMLDMMMLFIKYQLHKALSNADNNSIDIDWKC